MSVLDFDNSLRFLVDAHVNRRSYPRERLVAELGKLRMGFSLQWLSKISKDDCEKSIAVVLNTIFRYADHQEPTVRIGAYNALGGLLTCVTPFIPHEFTNAFNTAVAPLPISPKISIAIINTFVYLTRFITPVHINEFVSKVQVSTHFSVDMTENLKFLPQIIPLMNNLPIEFHQNILRSLVFKCGRNPNAAFVSCVVSLIDCQPNQLLNLLVQFIQENNLMACAVWLGPQILNKKKNYDLLDNSGRKLFVDAAIAELSKEPATNLSIFESSCMICSLYLNYIKGTNDYDEFQQKIREITNREFSSVYKVRLFLLPTPLEELQDDPKDTDQIKSAKLSSLASYFENNEDCDPDVISEMFLKYKNSENDLYCVLVESFARCIKRMLKTCKKRFHLQLLELILKTKNKNWVHDEAVTKVIDEIEPSLIPRYVDLTVDRLVEFSLSSNERLCQSAIKSFVKFASYSNLDMILSRLMWSDWIDESVCEKRFKLLSKLAKNFKVPQFQQFVPIAFEVMQLYDDTRVSPHAFLFLSRVEISDFPEIVREFSFKYIVKYLQQYTHMKVDSSCKKYFESIIDEPFLDKIDTDIVSNPVLNHKKTLKHIKNCFMFLISLKPEQIKDFNAMFSISLTLIPIFDIIALDECILMYNKNPVNFDALMSTNNYLLMTTSDDEVAASCLSLIIRTGRQVPDHIIKIAKMFLADQNNYNTNLIFFSFVIVDQHDHEFTMDCVDKALKRMNQLNQIALLYKLLHVAGNFILPKISEENSLALIEFSNEQQGRYDEQVTKYLTENTITRWILDDTPIRRNLLLFLSRVNKKWKVSNPETFKPFHWQFIFDNKQWFEWDNLTEYIKENIRQFNFYDLSFIIEEKIPEKKFALKPINNTKLSTAAPLLMKGKFIKEIGLLRSFFENHQKQIDTNVFMKSFEFSEANFDINAMNAVLDFATRVKQPIDLSIIQRHMIVLTDRVFSHFIKCFSGNGFIDSLSDEIKEKIERKIGAKIQPNLIMQYTKSKNIAAFVDSDPSYFLKFFESEPDYKSKQIAPLISFLQNPLFNIEFIFDFCLRLFVIFPEMQTSNKKSAFTRFLLACIDSLQTKKNIQKRFVDLLIENLPNMINYITDACVSDVLKIYKYLIPYCINALPNFITNVVTTPYNSILLTYTIETEGLVHVKGILPGFAITQSYMESSFKTQMPSLTAALMRTLNLYIDVTQPTTNILFVIKLINSLYNHFDKVEKNFLVARDFSSLIVSLLSHPQSSQIPLAFSERIKSSFLSDSRKACIVSSLPFITLLGMKDFELIKNLFNLPFDSIQIDSSIEDSYGQMLQVATDNKEHQALKTQFLNMSAERFVNFPSARLGRFILSLLQNTPAIDAPSFLFNNLSQKSRDFAVLFSVLGVFLSRNKYSAEDCAKCVQSDAFKIQSRVQSILLVCSGSEENNGISFLIASSETEDVTSITQAFDQLSE